ncbi:MAG: ornithine carbamoyltransferase [Planctomycetales bacterium]|nr:ornithine carbamoyltransferase [Planctomycetales bacterium]
MRHLLSLLDVSQLELQAILEISEQTKELLSKNVRPAWLQRRVLAMLFEKQSLRTRVSFDAGIAQLGGSAMFLGHEVGWQKREKSSDFIRVLSQYADFVVCRAKSHDSVVELAEINCIPVINGLTDKCHPCQALADLMTIRSVLGDVRDKQVTFVGDGNNVAYSLAIACAMVGMRFRLLGPAEYFMPDSLVTEILAPYPDSDIDQTSNIAKAMREADVVYTDVWTSMGQEAEEAARIEAFSPFQLNGQLMSCASKGCKILHCLPARRGQEITDEVIDSPDSLVFEQAGNRMHAQKGLLIWLALQHGQISPETLTGDGVRVPAK